MPVELLPLKLVEPLRAELDWAELNQSQASFHRLTKLSRFPVQLPDHSLALVEPEHLIARQTRWLQLPELQHPLPGELALSFL